MSFYSPPPPDTQKKTYAEFSQKKNKKHNSSRCGLCTLFELMSWKCYSPGHPEFSSQPLQLLLSHGSDQLRFHVKVLGVSMVESMKSVETTWSTCLLQPYLNKKRYLSSYSGLKKNISTSRSEIRTSISKMVEQPNQNTHDNGFKVPSP